VTDEERPEYLIDYAGVDENGPPDIAALKEQGIKGAIIRADYSAWKDDTFKRDASRFLDAGMILGAYSFALHGRKVASHEAEAAAFGAETDFIYRGGYQVLPPMVDYEIPKGNASTGLSTAELLSSLVASVAAYRTEYGVDPILYISGRVYNTTDTDCLGGPKAGPELTECPLALAHYIYKTGQATWFKDPGAPPTIPNPWQDLNLKTGVLPNNAVGDNYFFHQYQGDCRGIKGIRQADVNLFHPLKRGAYGKRTAWVQRRLGGGINVDGSFGPVTEEAIKDLQADHRLPVNGRIDLSTFEVVSWRKPT
jgi:peptidoglycan hydrolase-like protein with peptidoglycan-binding domain